MISELSRQSELLPRAGGGNSFPRLSLALAEKQSNALGHMPRFVRLGSQPPSRRGLISRIFLGLLSKAALRVAERLRVLGNRLAWVGD